LKSLDHPNVIKLQEVHESKQSIYLILELLEGGELMRRVSDLGYFINEEDIRCIMKHLLLALEYIHGKKIMHRDLKPENIVFKTSGEYSSLKIVDFGLAEYEGGGKMIYSRCGTPGYVAPEIFKTEGYDSKCDIFSAGCILYYL
jgi:serine/threonine protein kinase